MTIGFPWHHRIPSRSNEEVRQLAMALIAGYLVTDRNVPQHEWSKVFVPLGFLMAEGGKKLKNWLAFEPGLIYGQRDKHRTTGWCVNGWPMFFEIGVLNKADAERLYRLARRIHASSEELAAGS